MAACCSCTQPLAMPACSTSQHARCLSKRVQSQSSAAVDDTFRLSARVARQRPSQSVCATANGRKCAALFVVAGAILRTRRHRATRFRLGFRLSALPDEPDLPLAPPGAEAAAQYIHQVIDAVDDFIATSDVGADSSSTSSTGGAAQSWQQVGRPPAASCRVRITRPRTRVCMSVDTAALVDDGFELIQSPQDGCVTGAVPLFLEIAGWPTWYPFCSEARLLGEWGPSELARPDGSGETGNPIWGSSNGVSYAALWQIIFKLGPILTVDTVGLAVERPGRLDKDGQLWHYLFNPEPATKSGPSANTCLGVVVPEVDRKAALISLRVPLAWSRTAFKPLARDGGVINFFADVVNLVPPGPFRWAIRLFWGTLATRSIGIMRRHLENKIGPLSRDRLEFYKQLTLSMQSCWGS